MNAKPKRHWLEVIGLLTAAVGFATAFAVLLNTKATIDHTANTVQSKIDYNTKLQADLDADKARAAAKAVSDQVAAACSQHQSNIAAIDARFSALMLDHPILMNSLKSCATQSDDDSKGTCVVAVCAISSTVSGASCLDIASDVFSVRTDFQREKNANAADQCHPISTSLEQFFDARM